MEYRDIVINQEYTFEELVPRLANTMAITAAREIAAGKVEASPLFICGGAGCEGSLLMNAIANEFLKIHPERRVVLTTVKLMDANEKAAWHEGKMAEFREWYRSAGLLLVEGVEALEYTMKLQEELFNTYNAMTLGGKILVFLSTKELSCLEVAPRLRQRFAEGIVVQI